MSILLGPLSVIEKKMKWFSEISDFDSLEEKISIDRGIFLVGNENQTKTQSNVSESFGYQWSKRNIVETKETDNHMKDWLTERFGAPNNYISTDKNAPIIMLDAGCGASMSALAYFERTTCECTLYRNRCFKISFCCKRKV